MRAAEQAVKLSIRLAPRGCANRPVYYIVVMPKIWRSTVPPYEKIGIYDPMPNERNECLVGINFERLHVWLGKGATMSNPLKELLGLAGYLPIHPRTYMTAWRNRRKALEATQKEGKQKQEDTESSS